MPSPWKRSRLSRLVSSLRPKRPPPDSPLLVQTGFPTSLADLVVKNRSRIHHRRRKSTASAAPAPLAAFASQIADAVDPPASDPPDDPPALDAPPPPAAEPEAPNPPAAGVACQAKLVLFLALAVCTRELVLGVTLSALLLLLLESAGSWLLARSGAPPASAVPAESSELGRRKHWKKTVAETLRRPTRRKDPTMPGLDPNYKTGDSTSPEEGIEPGPNWRRRRAITITGPAFLLVTALSGLAGGKLAALVLTVAGCYLMRAPWLAKIEQPLLADMDGGE